MSINSIIAQTFDISIEDITNVYGGDINMAYKIQKQGKTFFIKVNDAHYSKEMFDTEARGLITLRDIAKIRVPNVIEVLTTNEYSILVLEWIQSGRAKRHTNTDIAIQLAKLHGNKNNLYGLEYDNYLGTLNQINTFDDNWLHFYYINRIEYQLKMAIDKHIMPESIIHKAEKMFYQVEKDYPDVYPSLLHGDLWQGNYMVSQSGKAVFIDPAIYYGYREMDIAMMKLFGGYDSSVFEHYDELLPLDNDWQTRLRFHQLYYILAHVNLFGGGYVDSAIKIIQYYSG